MMKLRGYDKSNFSYISYTVGLGQSVASLIKHSDLWVLIGVPPFREALGFLQSISSTCDDSITSDMLSLSATLGARQLRALSQDGTDAILTPGMQKM